MDPNTSQPRISQESFDEVVRENQEEFDMDLQEALADAVAQFRAQGVSMDGICVSLEEFAAAAEARQLVTELEDSLGEPGNNPTALTQLLLTRAQQRCQEDAAFTRACGRAGCLGLCARLCLDVAGEESALPSSPGTVPEPEPEPESCRLGSLRAALGLLRTLLSSAGGADRVAAAAEMRDVFPAPAFKALCTCLRTFRSEASVQSLCLEVLTSVMRRHEGNKRSLHRESLHVLLVGCLEEHGEGPHEPARAAVVSACCQALNRYISDDDRRPGVHPNTYLRSRDLVLDDGSGVLPPLWNVLRASANESDAGANVDLIATLCSSLKLLAINDNTCQRMADHGLHLILSLLQKHAGHDKVSRHICGLLKNMSRNDSVKQAICSGDILLGVFAVLNLHSRTAEVAEQALGLLSSVTLRQPKHCLKIAEFDGVPLIVEAIKHHPKHVQVQRAGIGTLRNLVSSHETKHLTSLILEHDAEELIRQAHAEHPRCEEVAYAALRELGKPYKATWIDSESGEHQHMD